MATNTHAIDRARDLITHFEGCRDLRKDGTVVAYLCPAGVWTIGWGTTVLYGRPVRSGDNITRAHADQLLERRIQQVLAAIIRSIKVTTLPHQLAALISFAYNVGEGNFNKSTLLKKHNLYDHPGAANEFQRWDKHRDPKTRKLIRSPGLHRRRLSERNQYCNFPNPIISFPEYKAGRR